MKLKQGLTALYWLPVPPVFFRCDGTDPDAVGQTLANMEALERMFQLSQLQEAAAPARK